MPNCAFIPHHEAPGLRHPAQRGCPVGRERVRFTAPGTSRKSPDGESHMENARDGPVTGVFDQRHREENPAAGTPGGRTHGAPPAADEKSR